MIAAGFSTAAIDTSTYRSTERLTAFLSEIATSDPIDNYFNIHPTLDWLREKAKLQEFGRQIVIPVNLGGGVNFKYYSGHDVFSTSGTDSARPAVYAGINAGSSIAVSDEEEDEVAGSNHALIDLMKHKRTVCIEDVLDRMNADLYNAAEVAGEINSLAIMIDSSGTYGGLDPSTYTTWVSTETAGGSFAAQGVDVMTTMLNTLRANKGKTSVIMTTQTVHEYYNKYCDPDVRYVITGKDMAGAGVDRGWDKLRFHGIPVDWDPDCTSAAMFFIDTSTIYLYICPSKNFSFRPFTQPDDQMSKVSLFAARLQLVCSSRRANGKLTGITA